MIDLQAFFTEHNFEAKGVIHIGGDGAQLELYEKMGFKRILFVEKDPEVFAQLHKRMGTRPHALGVNLNIDDSNGFIHVRANLVGQRCLDTLLIELGVHPRAFNLLVLDIDDKAACDVLTGAKAVLDRVDAIYASPRVPLARMPQHLSMRLNTPDTSAPALFTRRPTINLWQNPQHGRFGNELFHYFITRLLARHHGCELHTAPWPGQALFDLNDPLLLQEAPVIQEHTQKWDESELWGSLRGKHMTRSVKNTCVSSHFQFHTSIYTEEERAMFRGVFKPGEALEYELKGALKKAMGDNKTLVAIHVRRGDYTDNAPTFAYRTPVESYKKWLAAIWPTLESPVLYVASDDPHMHAEFPEFAGIRLDVAIPHQFYVDFWVLSQADALAISNSSFSFAAAMINPHRLQTNYEGMADHWFVRPLKDGSMVPFNPWDDDVLRHRYDAPEFPDTETACLTLLRDLLPALDIMRAGAFVEIGLGSFAWYFVTFSSMGYECHTVEPMPVPEVEAVLKICSRTTLFKGVMGERSGEATLYPGRVPDLNSMDPTWWGRDLTTPAVLVPAISLRTFVAGIGRPVTCLKLDVEGAEPMILEQLAGLDALPAAIMFEYSTTPPTETTPRDRSALDRAMTCLAILRAVGYEAGWRVENHQPPEPIDLLTLPLPLGVDAVFPAAVDYGNFIVCRRPSAEFAKDQAAHHRGMVNMPPPAAGLSIDGPAPG